MTAIQTIDAVVCTACGTTCDDIVVRANGGAIVAAERACPACAERLVGATAFAPAAFVNGKATTVDEACRAAADVLASAQRSLVAGLRSATTATLRAAAELADRLGAVIDWTIADCDAAATLALQTVGAVTATWGEVAQRADTVVYWASDPHATHPRMQERFTEQPASRWLPDGRSDRYVVVVDDQPSSTSANADETISISAGAHYEVLCVLRALAQNLTLDPARVLQVTGVELAQWVALMARMRDAKYGAVIVGKRLAGDGRAAIAAIAQLLGQLTATTRWVALDEGGPGNTAGASNVLTWQAGAPMAIDFAQGVPHYRPLEASAPRLLARGEVDAVLVVGDLGRDELLAVAGSRWDDYATIALCEAGKLDPAAADIVIGITRPGIDESGTTYRSDGVALPMRAPLPASRPTAAAVLAVISHQLSVFS